MVGLLQFLDHYALLLEAIAQISAFIGLVVLIYELYGTKVSIQLSTVRQRREATFALYREEREIIRKQHAEIKTALGLKDSMIMEDWHLATVIDDENLRGDIISLLQKLERFSLGIKLDTFDYEVSYQLSRANLMGMFGTYHHYIIYAREKTPTAYNNFEDLVNRFEIRTQNEGLAPSVALQNARQRQAK